MTTTVVFADVADGYIQSTGTRANYANVRAGLGLVVDAALTYVWIGQGSAEGNCWVGESFVRFDTSSVASDTVSSALLSLVSNGAMDGPTSTLEARIRNQGASLTASDWVPGASLGNYTLVAHCGMALLDVTGPYVTLTDDALAANINGAGQTFLMLSASSTRLGVTPPDSFTTYDDIRIKSADTTGTTSDPKLTVTHAASGSTVSGSLAAGAVIARPTSGSLTADAVIARAASGSLTANAYINRVVPGSLTAGSVIKAGRSSSVVAAAIQRRTFKFGKAGQ